MNDKSNILASLMGPASANKENVQSGGCNGTQKGARLLLPQISPTSAPSPGAAGKQHKLKQRFTVIRKLGKGTYGKVQLAINKETGQEVAIKTIKKTKIENEQDLQRVRREIQIMSSIEHPHIIHIYEVFENKDKIVLVMQYAPGGELYEYVSQCKLLDDSEARRLFRQIATAIYYCHQNKICHRDLKLENILLDEKNNAKLADFGLSNVFDKSHQLKTFCGSPLYASPEIVQGSPYEGPEVDCWSLGVLLYTLVYGAMPFDGSNFKRLVKQISESCYFEPKQKSQASPLIRRLLCADPKERATILDICSDPWVNGLTVNSGDSPGAGASIGSGHQSLLKVAQDMANLTPVRFDILLALTPDSRAASAAAAATDQSMAARPPLARVDNAHRRRSSGGDRPPGWRGTSPATLDPSIMEVEEGRSTSPVASYIVRDLSSEKTRQTSGNQQAEEGTGAGAEQPEEVNGENATDQTLDRFELDQEQLPEVSTEKQQDEIQVEVQQEEQEAAVELSKDHSMMSQDEQPEIEQPIEDTRTPTVETLPAAEVVSAEKVDESPPVDESMTEGQRPEEPTKDEEPVVSMEVDSGPREGAQLEVQQTAEATLCGTDTSETKETSGAATVSEEAPKEPEVDGSGKPKKVKKKVVVVKKRKKRVSKKEEGAGGGGGGDEAKDVDRQDEDKEGKGDKEAQDSDSAAAGRQSRKGSTSQDSQAKPAKAKGPGKVRIPNTFQSDGGAQEPVVLNRAEARRQSALVADVSQKLLQSAAPTSPAHKVDPIQCDQPQLANVRVSDKKSDFERRASLATSALPVAKSQPPSSPSPVAPANSQQPELYQGAELVREPSVDEQQTMMEPVERQGPKEVEPAPSCLKPSIGTSQDGSESQTPTIQRQSVDLQAADVQRKLLECANRLQESRSSNGDELQAPSENDRSDSVETIKAEGAAAGHSPVVVEMPPASIRSQFSIQLDGANRNAGSAAATERTRGDQPETTSVGAVATGPAPITRSYKKVTFTKDGACITETGRIYSTQGRDGTVRRVERKSKVTHYPVKGGFDHPTPVGDLGAAAAAAAEHVEEEEVYEEGGTSSWPPQEEPQRRSVPSRPLERLIIPSTNMDTDPFGTLNSLHQDNFGFASARPPSSFGGGSSSGGRPRSHSRQLGRADSSCSSCSSGSTDVFDDIFDHWTGAISMFNQASAFGHHFRSPFGRASGGRTSSGRRSQAGGSLAGTPRCESAEPPGAWPPADGATGASPGGGHRRQHSGGRHRRHRDWRSPGATNTSGYESDVASERPATALGSTTRGSLTRLFPSFGHHQSRHADPFAQEDSPLEAFDSGDLRRTIAQQHESLRQRLEQQHRHFWKGSTPSLFSDSANDPFMEPAHHHQQTHSRKPPGSIGQMLRNQMRPAHDDEDSFSRPLIDSGWRRPPRPESSSGSSGQQQQQSGWPRENHMEQSQSSNSFLRQSNPLDSAPRRQPTTQLPPRAVQPKHEAQSMQRSTSKVSLLSQQVGVQDEAASAEQHKSTKHHASFIELKRTSSSASAHQQKQVAATSSYQQQQHLETAAGKTITSSRVISTSGSSSAFWETVVTPNTPLSCSLQSGQPPLDVEGRSLARDNLDSRVQSWLQESTSNMSTSSGSKSSVSDQGRAAQQSEGSHLGGISRLERLEESLFNEETGGAQVQHASPSRAAAQREMIGRSAAHSSAVASSTSTSSANWASEQQQQQLESQMMMMTMRGNRSPLEAQQNRQVTTKATFTLRQPPGAANRSPEMEETAESFSTSSKLLQQQQMSSSSVHQMSRRSPTTPGGRIGASDGPAQWIHESSSRTIFGEELDDSLSGSGDLESPSSSSLLDQLRSRGYRSMINQRMVAQQSGNSSAQIVSQTSSSQQQVSTSSSSRVVTSSSKTKVVQQQHRQLITSSSSSSQQDKRPTKEEEEVVIAAEGPEWSYQLSNGFGQHQPTCVPSEFSELDGNIKEHRTDMKIEDVPTAIGGDNETAQTNGVAREGERGDKPEAGPDKEVDEDEEDVREAKASIKMHLDRVKETELFLKSLHAEEAEAERQRQQLFMFNNLMLSTKLNGIKSRTLNDDLPLITDSPMVTTTTFTGNLSAPVYMSSSKFGNLEAGPATNGYTSCGQLPLEDGFLGNSMGLSSSYAARKLREQPLPSLLTNRPLQWGHNHMKVSPANTNGFSSPPVVRYNPSMSGYSAAACNGEGCREFRRSRSQLGDQFSNWKAPPGRPVSANLDNMDWVAQSGEVSCETTLGSVYFPSARSHRSMSQIRQPLATAGSTGSRFSYAVTAQPEVATNHDEEEDDDEMSAYRASSYVPKVVPQGAPTLRSSRRYQTGTRTKRELTTSDWSLSSSGKSRLLGDLDASRTSLRGYEETKRERRISLQEAAGGDCKSPRVSLYERSTKLASSPIRSPRNSSPAATGRRRSLTTTTTSSVEPTGSSPQSCSGERSRLSELEQRIQENKRRREELLAGRLSPDPASSELTKKSTTSADGESTRTESKDKTPASSIKLSPRSSRLESMEARIKRKSFYVRTSPERSNLKTSKQSSLDRWSTRRGSGGSTGCPRVESNASQADEPNLVD